MSAHPGDPRSAPPAGSIHAHTALGAVGLTVADPERLRAFYEEAVGLRTLERAEACVRLGAAPGRPLVELRGDPAAPPRPPRSTGLFHLALLVPSRAELALALRRVVAAGWRFTGASDHLVSEALYLGDPEGNGIEIYRDRPRSEWPRAGGELRMETLPLDLERVMRELPDGDEADGLGRAARLGHVHLQVADLAQAGRFYEGVLGFDVTVRSYPGALFLSAGGYHHHIGLNTWASAGAPSPPPGARGLRCFEVVLPDEAELERIARRVAAAGLEAERGERGLLVADPSGNRVLLRAAGDG
ncbi:MAG: VOC family protein [Nocardioidaceae bacterium]